MDQMAAPDSAFCFPVKRLENSRLILDPFNFSSHAEPFVHGTKDYPELFDFVSQGPFATTAEFAAFYKSRIESSNRETLFAILKKPTPPGEHHDFAGMIGLQNANVLSATIEIGFVRCRAELTILHSSC